MSDLNDKQQWPVLKLPEGAPVPTLRAAEPTRGPIALQIKSLKITAVLSPGDLPPIADGVSELRLDLEVGGSNARVTARLNPRTYRRVWRMISENGADNVSVILQGRMSKFGLIEDAGLAANVKTPKPAGADARSPAEPD